jgi:hypothetical protein
MQKNFFLISIVFSFSSFSQNVSKDDGIDLSDSKLPWELVTDRGKILDVFTTISFILLAQYLLKNHFLENVH